VIETVTKNRLVTGLLATAAAGAFVLGLTPVVHAASAPFTFAQFHEASSSNANEFAYLDNGTDAEFVTPAPVAATFTFLGLSGPGIPVGPQAAIVTLSSSTVLPVMTAFAGAFGDQAVNGSGALVDKLTILRASDNANLLTVTFTGGLLGAIGGRTPQLSANTDAINPGTGTVDTITYSSDFIPTFGTDNNFSVTTSSWTTIPGGGGGLAVSPDGFFALATAAAAGTFNTSTVPEPGTLALGALGITGLLARRRRASL